MSMKRTIKLTAVAGLVLGLLASVPAHGQVYHYFPGGPPTDDGRTVVLAGDDYETLAQDSIGLILVVPAGESEFEIGIFDGETGLTGTDGTKHWDNGSTQLQYALFYDPFQIGNTDPADLVGVWRGNETGNPTDSDPLDPWKWTTFGLDRFPDNDWWSLMVDVEEPPAAVPGMAPSGTTSYHLCVSYRGATSSATDPCTGDVRPADPAPTSVANFKLRATANISVVAYAFAYEAALRFGGHGDLDLVYPDYPDLSPTSYDGRWEFSIDVPVSAPAVELFDGDFDFGTDPADPDGYPSGDDMFVCVDTDDPDTPNDSCFPSFAVVESGGVCTRLDDSLPEGARTSGGPPDDNRFDVYRRDGCVNYRLTSPDDVDYYNDNPSSQREWERFLISSDAGCAAGSSADYCAAEPLLPGEWRLEVAGVDMSNLNGWRGLYGFCGNCLPSRPYLIGDTVFADYDGDGVQDELDFGIEGVTLELIDWYGRVLGSIDTNDSGGYEPGDWTACQERNTGGATPHGLPVDESGLYCFGVAVPNLDPEGADSQQYTVRVAPSNFAPGGAIHDFLGGDALATRPSPLQVDVVHEGGDNVMSYDFGYWLGECGPCAGKARHLTFRYLGYTSVLVRIERKAGGDSGVIFEGSVAPDGTFSVFGPEGGKGGFAGTLGTEITIFVEGVQHVTIHTSCSQPLGPGQVWGDFLILAGSSKNGGPFCPLGEDSALTDSGSDDVGGGKTSKGKAK